MIAKGFLEAGAEGLHLRRARPRPATRPPRSCGAAVHLAAAGHLDGRGLQGAGRAYLGEREDKLDILVNNAGAAWGAEFDEFPESGWDKVMNLNLKSPFFLTQALHATLKAAASTSGRPR